jgi:hypothetical protein
MYAKYKAKFISSLLLEQLIKNFVNMKVCFKLATRLIKYEPVRCLFDVGCPVTQANVHSSIVQLMKPLIPCFTNLMLCVLKNCIIALCFLFAAI